MRVRFAATVLLALLCLAAFGRSAVFEFVYDDEEYLLTNQAIGAGVTSESLLWATTAFHSNNWHPVTWVSHAIDVGFFGLRPAGHHLVNVLLHTLASLLLFASLYALGGRLWQSCVVAALFAVHPLHAETVSWVSERKGILSAIFLGLTVLSYSHYARSPSVRRYLPILPAFSLGLMSKPTLVCLPLALLLLDFWPLGRFNPSHPRAPGSGPGPRPGKAWRIFAEKAPLLLLSAGAGLLTYLAQKSGGALRAAELYPFDQRLGNAAVTTLAYLGATVFPQGLMFFYPHPGAGLAALRAIGAGGLLLGVTAWTWKFRHRLPHVFFGWHWYLVMLLPVLGLLQVGDQARADRYTYLPLIGIFVGIAWCAAAAAARRPRLHGGLTGAAILLVLLSTVLSFLQSATWRTTVTLSEHALRVDPDNWFAHQLRAVPLAREGDIDGALLHLEEALRQQPGNVTLLNNTGFLLGLQGHVERAIGLFRKALVLRPDYAESRFNMAVLYLGEGRHREAAAENAILRVLDRDRAEKLDALIRAAGAAR